MTERLYYTDSFLLQFDAEVVETLVGPRPTVVLNATAFYPTSGGQTSDTGWFRADGQEWRVVEVEEGEAGRILHVMSGPAALAPGTRVQGCIDEARRRDHIQQHSGQHILSAAFVRRFDMPTVSFHMGEETCSIDLQASSLVHEQVAAAEDLANQVVQEDRPVRIEFASLERARQMGLRKLPPEPKDELRLIDICEFDLTACGGTHVRTTGQVGPIALRNWEKVKQGVRVEFVCGHRAIRAARQDRQALTTVAASLSTHSWKVPQEIERVLGEARQGRKAVEEWMGEAARLEAVYLVAEAASSNPRIVTKIFPNRSLEYVKLVAQKIARNNQNPAVALLGAASPAPVLVFAQTPGAGFDMGALLKESLAARGGRGGGTRDMAQGGVPSPEGLEATLRELAARLHSASPAAPH